MRHKIKTSTFLKNIFVIYTSIALFVLLAFFIKPEFLNSANENYIPGLFAYHSAYSIVARILEPTMAVGFWYLLLMFIGFFQFSNDDEKYFNLQQFFVLIFSLSIFLKIQDINHHHLYLFLPTIIYFAAKGILKIFSIKNIYTRMLAFTIVGIYILLSYKIVFLNKVNLTPTYSLLPNIEYPAPQRTDIKVIDSLIEFLDDNVNNEKIYVVSSSYSFNGDILMERSKDLGAIKVVNNLLKTFDVDRRDGYPYHFNTATFIVLTNPVGYHLEPEEQTVIGTIHNLVTTSADYIKISNCYLIENNICVEIYKKVKT